MYVDFGAFIYMVTVCTVLTSTNVYIKYVEQSNVYSGCNLANLLITLLILIYCILLL